MLKALLPKAKRSWLKPLLPTAMAETAEARLLKSREAAAQALAAKAVSRRQNPEVAVQALVATPASRLQSLASD